jgi:hypothetical protein
VIVVVVVVLKIVPVNARLVLVLVDVYDIVWIK